VLTPQLHHNKAPSENRHSGTSAAYRRRRARQQRTNFAICRPADIAQDALEALGGAEAPPLPSGLRRFV